MTSKQRRIGDSFLRDAIIGLGSGLGVGLVGFALIYNQLPASPGTTNLETSPIVYGSKSPDGSIYAGISPDTGRPMYATPTDARLIYTFDQANSACAKLDAHGHKDWRVPTKAELNVLFLSRAAIGGFNTAGSGPAGWYWSSSRGSVHDSDAWAQRFSDGHQYDLSRYYASALRCVRG
jgi:hypothetical protein